MFAAAANLHRLIMEAHGVAVVLGEVAERSADLRHDRRPVDLDLGAIPNAALRSPLAHAHSLQRRDHRSQ
ncbi:MAG TPA: hypothetical protein VFN75_03175 [Pseudonocardiaceae bacterium]|nr:hypothetical protein [Pseudonocardiaceae bacterium]